MDDGNPLLCVVIFLIFIGLDAILFGFGAAIQDINTSELEKSMEAGNKKAARLLRIVNRPTRFIHTVQIVTCLIGVITGGFILGILGTGLERLLVRTGVEHALLLSALSLVLAVVAMIVLLVTFGIVIPKRCAARTPEKWGYACLEIVYGLMILTFPVNALVNGLSYIFLKMIGIDMYAVEENVTEEEIMSMVNEGHEQGILEAREAEMITNIFELNDKSAGDIMTHRKNLVALDGTRSLGDTVDFILKEGSNSRYPVYNRDIDDVMGILHMKDALIAAEIDGNREKPIKEIPGLLREAPFIPETRHIDSLFKEMQMKKIHMVIVIDEYGQTAGIVTMEDILEEIVGNIMDEYDQEEEDILPLDDGSFLIRGMAYLDDVSKALDLEFTEEEEDSYDTMNGLLISKLDRIPKEGEQAEIPYGPYIFQIQQVENKMIRTIKAIKQTTEESHEENDETASHTETGEPE